MVLAVLYVLLMIGLLGWPSSVYLFAQTRNRPSGATSSPSRMPRGRAATIAAGPVVQLLPG